MIVNNYTAFQSFPNLQMYPSIQIHLNILSDM